MGSKKKGNKKKRKGAQGGTGKHRKSKHSKSKHRKSTFLDEKKHGVSPQVHNKVTVQNTNFARSHKFRSQNTRRKAM